MDMSVDKMAGDGYKISSGQRNYIFVLLCLLYFFDALDRYIVSSIFPFIKKEFLLSDVQSGMLVATVYWSLVILVVPTSIIVDRWSRKKTIGIMAIVWSISSMACAFVGNFAQLFTARTFLGAGEAGYGAGGTAMITGMYRVDKRALMFGIFAATAFVANAAALALGGFIAIHWGWRAAFGLTAVPGLLMAFMFFFIKDYKTVELVKTVKAGAEKVKMKFVDSAKEFLHTPTLYLTYLALGMAQFVSVAVITWLPSYFNRTAGIPMDQAGLKAASVMMMVVIGAPVGGYLCDFFVKKTGIKSRLYFATIALVISAALAFVAFWLTQGNIQYAVLMAMALFTIMFAPAATMITQEVIHPGLRAISAGLSIIVANLLGGSLAPVVIGAISDATDLQTAMKILPLFLVVAAVFVFIASFFFTRDHSRVEKVELQAER
jgi:MFS family permease